jgi:hypothetical protein
VQILESVAKQPRDPDQINLMDDPAGGRNLGAEFNEVAGPGEIDADY